MNAKLKKINIEDCLFFDSETTAKHAELALEGREYELFQWKTRNRDTDEVLDNNALQALYKKTAALKIGFNQVVTVGAGYVKNNEIRIKAITGSEEEILKLFCQFSQKFKYLVGFNSIGFDICVIANNANRHFDLTEYLPENFNPVGKKEWKVSDFHCDLMLELKATGYSNMSFDEACYMYDIPSPKDGLKGSDVNRVYWERGIEPITNYVKKDVFSLINLFQAIRHQQKYDSFTDVQDIQPPTPTPLKDIYNSDYFSDQSKQQLGSKFPKKLTKKDRETIKTILEAIYIRSEFQDSDNLSVQTAKKSEIEEFVKTLK